VEASGERIVKRMTAVLSKVRWGRVLLAAIAAHVLGVVFAAMAAVVAVAVGSAPDSALVAGLAGRMATWSVPVLTFFAAAWVVRTAERGTASLHGLLVGLLGAVFFGVHYYWPFNLAALGMHVLVIAAGWLGSMVGTRSRTLGRRPMSAR
jgi:hypothetical protein